MSKNFRFFARLNLGMPTVQSTCFSCRRGPRPCDEHPCFAQGGPLAGLGGQLACLLCLGRLRGAWPLAKRKIEGECRKHGWCLMCGGQPKSISDMRAQLGMTMQEFSTLGQNGHVDDEESLPLFTCDNGQCPRSFCSLCVLRNWGIAAMLDADAGVHWACPICAGAVLAPLSVAAQGAALSFAFWLPFVCCGSPRSWSLVL